jgi:hypothetical protein
MSDIAIYQQLSRVKVTGATRQQRMFAAALQESGR